MVLIKQGKKGEKMKLINDLPPIDAIKQKVKYANLYVKDVINAIKNFGATSYRIKPDESKYNSEDEAFVVTSDLSEENMALANVLYTEALKCSKNIYKREDGYVYWGVKKKSPIIYTILQENKSALQILKDASEQIEDIHLLVAYNVCDIHLNDLKRKKKVSTEKEM